MIDDTLRAALACPGCGGALAFEPSRATCARCGDYPLAATGPLDLRLRAPRTVSLSFDLEPRPAAPPIAFRTLAKSATPAVDFSGVRTPWHLSPELLSHFPRAREPGKSLALDLGCGSGVHRSVCEHAGFRWVGLDHASRDATLLGDAHALPFRDASVGFVLSIAVLEHVRLPFVALREVRRVLEPGGLFVGTVAFLEPFHGDSYLHHTHLGTWDALRTAGLEPLVVAPSDAWNGLVAQASMSLFPRMPESLARVLVLPLRVMHRLWWMAGRLVSKEATEEARVILNAGAISFVARKRA